MAAETREFKTTRFDPTTGKSSSFFNAVSKQVEADWGKQKLAMQHASGKINDKEYIQGLQDMLDNYRKGTGLRLDIKETLIGAAQAKASSVAGSLEEQKSTFLQDAQSRWIQAQNDYASGSISTDEFNAEKDLYKSAIQETREVPSEKKLTKQILSGKFWDQYQSGRMKNIMRDKQIKEFYRSSLGLAEQEKLTATQKEELQSLKAAPAKLPYIQQAIGLSSEVKKKRGTYYAYGKTRDLSKEQSAIGPLRKALGRLPTSSEVNAYVYGLYPIEYVTQGAYDAQRGYYE